MKTKTLVLIRHAKSSWEFDVSDSDRPLNKRGLNDAKLVSLALMKKNFSIDKVYSSPANRAYSTCKIFQEILNWNKNLISLEEKLYDFSGYSVTQFISDLDNDLDTVALFGHNHAFTSIINIFGDRLIDNLPTSGLVVLSFNVDSWKYVKYGHTELMLFPRDFK